MAIQDCVEYVETVVNANVTLAGSESYPTEEQKTGLFSISFEDDATFEGRGADWAQSFHNISVYVLGAKTNMLHIYSGLAGKMESIAIALLKDETLNGKCDTFSDVTYTKATLNLSGVDYVGYRLVINQIKIQRSLTS